MNTRQFFNTRAQVQHSRCCFWAWSRPRFHQHCRHRTPLLLLRRRTNRQAGAYPGKIARDQKRVMSAHSRYEYVFITTGILADVCCDVLAAHTLDFKTVFLFQATPLAPHSGAQRGTARTLVCALQAADLLRRSPSSPNSRVESH